MQKLLIKIWDIFLNIKKYFFLKKEKKKAIEIAKTGVNPFEDVKKQILKARRTRAFWSQVRHNNRKITKGRKHRQVIVWGNTSRVIYHQGI